MSVRDVIVIGAGPSGLSAAIAAKKRSLDYLVIEQGILVNSIYRFPPQMVFFTTPELLEIGGLPFVSPHDKPTRVEALKYYRKVVETYDLQIAFDEKVLAIRAEPDEALEAGEPTLFSVETQSGRGVRRVRLARTVVLAVGYYDHPVTLNIPGEDLPHVHHYYTEAHPYYRQRVIVVGGGNSSAEAALELHRAGAHVTLVHRRAALRPTIKYWVRPDIENRIKEGSIVARFGMSISEIRPASVVLAPVDPAQDLSASAAQASVPQVDRPAPSTWSPVSGEAPLEADAHERVAHEYEVPERESLRSSARESEVRPASEGRPPRELDEAGPAGTLEAESPRSRPRESEEATGERGWGPASDKKDELPCDTVFLLTGYRADSTLFTNAGVTLTARDAPVYDPKTFETNVPGLYVAGGALAGMDTGSIFIENGRFHGETIIEAIARRRSS